MDLYLKHFCVSDFVFANADYFNVQKGFHSSDEAVEDSAMQTVLAQNGVKESGCVYGQTTRVLEKIKKKDMLAYFTSMGHTMTKEQEKGYFNWKEQADDGSYYDDIQLYGMDAFPLQKVKVLKGDVTALDQENAIAAVYKQNDYDKKVDRPFYSISFSCVFRHGGRENCNCREMEFHLRYGKRILERDEVGRCSRFRESGKSGTVFLGTGMADRKA